MSNNVVSDNPELESNALEPQTAKTPKQKKISKEKKEPKEKKSKSAATPAPSSLTFSLAANGMSPMHRAGLGGLAATLYVLTSIRKKMEDEGLDSVFPFDSPLWNEDFSWEITPTTVTLNFGKPENAAAFLEWLFSFAFQIKDEMIFLPGQYAVQGVGVKEPPLGTRARLQQGITLTFLQHGQTRKLGKDAKTVTYEIDGKNMSLSYKPCLEYTHQSAWKEWVNNKGELVLKQYSVQGPIHPGAVVRHQAFTASTIISQPLELFIPLIFALVGTLCLPISGGVGVLMVPFVDNLKAFAKKRCKITPMIYRDSMIVSLGDAALQYEIRRRGGNFENIDGISGCDTVQFRPMPWSTQQKSRCETLTVERIDPKTLQFYDMALHYLPSRILEAKKVSTEGKGKNAVKTETVEYFLVDSIVRPLVADNLAREKYWFAGFAKLMSAIDPVSNKPLHQKISFEREGLNKMINDSKLDWKCDGARPLVQAVQQSLRQLYGKASSDQGVSSAGIKNRLEGEYDKWRMVFSGAKTPEQFRYALTDMFSRAKSVPSVQENWESIMMLVVRDWQLARDLALLGLAGYKGEGKKDVLPEQENASTK